jgi:hypothetical protein
VGGSISDRQQNQRFNMYDMKTPTKEEWFEWLIGKFKDDYHGVTLNMKVIEELKKVLKDEDISSDQETGEGDLIRMSPRRWEQLILYVNAAFPVKDKEDAMALLTNVRQNFAHYTEKETHKTSAKVLKAVSKLIKDIAGIDIAPTDLYSDTEWRHVLKHQIEMKKRLGDARKYVPVISGPPGIGKAQPVYSKIKTPTGWMMMGEAAVGDVVSTPDGGTANIIGVFPQGVKPIYKLTFKDGRTAEACAEHLWKIQKPWSTDQVIVSTEEMIRLLEDTTARVRIPLILNTNNTPDIELPINPYLLGCLLGDGCISQHHGSISISTADIEILENLTPPVLEHGCEITHKSKYDYYINKIGGSKVGGVKGTLTRYGTFNNTLKQTLFDLELLTKNSYTKFIPNMYKSASIKQKEELIAGLIDTDGWISKSGSISISTSSIQLAEDIQYIVHSIGGIAKIKSIIPKYTYKGEKLEGCINYNINIRYPTPKSLSKLTRKLDRIPDDYQYKNLKLQLVSVELIGNEEAQCIAIDHPDHLYITDNYIVTHNTANAAAIAEEMNLRLVPIDASELVDAGEVIGLPAPNKANGKMSVKFVASKLFKQVYNIMAYEDNKYHASLIQEHGQADGERLYKEYEGQRWKYLIFFDEFNRAPAPVMNALRRIILEKNFGEKDENGQMMKLPKEAIVMAAINPTGEGTHELTHHMRDVMDILPGSPSWSKQKAFLEKKPVRGATPEVKDAIINAIEHIAAKHGVKSKGAEVQPFYLDVGDNDGVYVTPNDMSDMYSMAARKVQDVINQAIGDGQVTDLPPEEIKQLDHDIKDAIYEAFEPSLRDVFDNHQLDASKWLDVFHKWLLGSTIGRDLTSTASEKVKKQESIGSILEKQLTTESSKPLMNNSAFVNYVKSNDHVSVTHEVDQWLRDLFSDNKKAKKYLTANGVNALKYDKDAEEFHKTDEKVPAIFNLLAEVVVALHANGFSGEVYTNMVEAIETIVDDTLHRLAKQQEITKDEYRKLHIEHADMLGELLEI